MQLHLLEADRLPSLNGDSIQSVKAGKLFYLYSGRNAWHSTWVQTYRPGCMHTRFVTAAAVAERLRKQGTVLYIEERPALEVRGARHVVIVTQINSLNPLQGYRLEPADSAPGAPPALRVGGDLGEAIASFGQGSACWSSRPKPFGSVMWLTVPAEGGLESLSPEAAAWTSFSNGSRYRLGWSKRLARCRSEAVEAILCAVRGPGR